MFVINGIVWDIAYVPYYSDKLTRTDGTQTFGCTNNNNKTIYIANNLHPKFNRKVVCHEICHAYCFSYGILFPLLIEEIVCDFVATYGYDILETTNLILGEIANEPYRMYA